MIEHDEIDRINILQASVKAMHVALKKLKTTPRFILVDGHYFKPFQQIPHQCVVRGDATYQSIAAAAILAKTYRDNWMREAAKKFPHYGWETNAGYPTKQHRQAIAEYGITPLHRRSFQLLPAPTLWE